MDAHSLAENRDLFTEQMPDQAVIYDKTITASTGQRGRRQVATAPGSVTVPCKAIATPIRDMPAGGQLNPVLTWMLRLPAVLPVGVSLDTSKRIQVTITETGETKTFEVIGTQSRSGMLARLVNVTEVG